MFTRTRVQTDSKVRSGVCVRLCSYSADLEVTESIQITPPAQETSGHTV